MEWELQAGYSAAPLALFAVFGDCEGRIPATLGSPVMDPTRSSLGHLEMDPFAPDFGWSDLPLLGLG